MITVTQALAALEAQKDTERAAQSEAYHKVARRYLGIAVPALTECARQWRAETTLPERIDLAAGLWASDIHEARIAAAKLFEQARIRPDDSAVWALIAGWVPDFDGWAIADHASIAGQKRLVAAPSRLDEVEGWTTSPHMWTRRAALVMTLPWTKENNPKPADLVARDRILGWAAGYAGDQNWFIQKAVAWWLRDLSRHDAARTRDFVDQYGPRMKPWAVKEALRHLEAGGAEA